MKNGINYFSSLVYQSRWQVLFPVNPDETNGRWHDGSKDLAKSTGDIRQEPRRRVGSGHARQHRP